MYRDGHGRTQPDATANGYYRAQPGMTAKDEGMWIGNYSIREAKDRIASLLLIDIDDRTFRRWRREILGFDNKWLEPHQMQRLWELATALRFEGLTIEQYKQRIRERMRNELHRKRNC